MIIPRQLVAHISVARCKVEAHAGAQLPRAFAMDLLPRRLALGHLGFPSCATFFPFCFGNQSVTATGAEVDHDAVACLEEGEPATDG